MSLGPTFHPRFDRTYMQYHGTNSRATGMIVEIDTNVSHCNAIVVALPNSGIPYARYSTGVKYNIGDDLQYWGHPGQRIGTQNDNWKLYDPWKAHDPKVSIKDLMARAQHAAA